MRLLYLLSLIATTTCFQKAKDKYARYSFQQQSLVSVRTLSLPHLLSSVLAMKPFATLYLCLAAVINFSQAAAVANRNWASMIWEEIETATTCGGCEVRSTALHPDIPLYCSRSLR
jgi:hypothetical protein